MSEVAAREYHTNPYVHAWVSALAAELDKDRHRYDDMLLELPRVDGLPGMITLHVCRAPDASPFGLCMRGRDDRVHMTSRRIIDEIGSPS